MELVETPLIKRKLQSKKYSKPQLEVLTTNMSEVMLGKKQSDESEMLQQLKEKFDSTSQNGANMQILMVLLKSLSIQKIHNRIRWLEFPGKQLVMDKGVLSSPDPQPGRQILQEAYDCVVSF